MRLYLGTHIKVSNALDADKAAVGVHGADLDIGICLDLLIAFLMGAHAEVQLILKNHHKAEGAHAGLIAIAACKEKAVAFFEIIIDFLNFAHSKFLLIDGAAFS